MTPTPTPEVIPLGAVELQTVEIVRKKSFTAPAAEADPTSLTTLDAEQIRRQLLQTGMSFEFRVTPPKGWDLIAVETASLVSLTDSAGAPLGRVTVQSDGASSNIDSLSAASTSELDSEFASVQLRTIPPPRGESLLRTLKASFKLQIGLRNTIHIHDLRNKLNQELLPGAAARGLGVQVTEIEKDRVTVAATGAIDEIGNLELVDLDKAALKAAKTDFETLAKLFFETHDPIGRLEARLKTAGLLTDDSLKAMQKAVRDTAVTSTPCAPLIALCTACTGSSVAALIVSDTRSTAVVVGGLPGAGAMAG